MEQVTGSYLEQMFAGSGLDCQDEGYYNPSDVSVHDTHYGNGAAVGRGGGLRRAVSEWNKFEIS